MTGPSEQQRHSDITALLFDHDDTLVSTFAIRARAWSATVEAVLGRPFDGGRDLRAHLGETIEAAAARNAPTDDVLAARLVSEYRTCYFRLSAAELTVFDGIGEALRALKADGLLLAVVTSKIGYGARAELTQAGILPLFDVIIGADDVAQHKPHPEPVLAACTQLGISPAQAVMIGDTTADVFAGRAAGARSAAAYWGTLDADALTAAEPDYSLHAIADLGRFHGAERRA